MLLFICNDNTCGRSHASSLAPFAWAALIAAQLLSVSIRVNAQENSDARFEPITTVEAQKPSQELLDEAAELRRLWTSERLVMAKLQKLGATFKLAPIGGAVAKLLDPEKREFVSELRVLRNRVLDQSNDQALVTGYAVRYVPYFRKLKRLSLDASLAKDEDLRAISKIDSLTTVVLYDASGVTDEGMAHLAQLPYLMVLQVYGANIGDQTLQHLQSAKELYELYLTSDRFSNAAIASASNISSLTQLSLVGGQIDDDGIHPLHMLTQLRHLDLSSTQITPRSVDRIGQFPALEVFVARSTQLTEQDFARVRLVIQRRTGNERGAGKNEKL